MGLGKIIHLKLQDRWPREDADFTPWLADNLEFINEALGLDLVFKATEESVGDFYADIVAVDVSNNGIVIIENQYGSTDHKHLGQLLTYASGRSAKAVVWIAENVRDEHKVAIDFLNRNLNPTDGLHIYLVQASLIKIDDSRPALILDIICAPTVDTIKTNSQSTDIQEKYRNYFQLLIDELREQYRFTTARTAQPQNWYSFSSENSKIFKYGTSFANKGRYRVEIYIDSGIKQRNEAIFDHLQQQKADIQSAFGCELIWEKLENKRACRIALYKEARISDADDNLADLRKWAIQSLIKFKEIFPDRISRIASDLPEDASDELEPAS